jgi:hypothetical protein
LSSSIKVNRVLKQIDYEGQTTVLAATSFVLVGMMFLVPGITEKALGAVHATAKVVCGTTTGSLYQNRCQLTLEGKTLDEGRWISEPTQYGTAHSPVTWSTAGKPPFGDEKGSVTYIVSGPLEQRTAVLTFYNPVLGINKCDVKGSAYGYCTAGKGQSAEFTYTVNGK